MEKHNVLLFYVVFSNSIKYPAHLLICRGDEYTGKKSVNFRCLRKKCRACSAHWNLLRGTEPAAQTRFRGRCCPGARDLSQVAWPNSTVSPTGVRACGQAASGPGRATARPECAGSEFAEWGL